MKQPVLIRTLEGILPVSAYVIPAWLRPPLSFWALKASRILPGWPWIHGLQLTQLIPD